MKPTRVIQARKQSPPARCEYMEHAGTSMAHWCGAQMQLVIKAPKLWSYQERVSERCWLGHIAHGQAVIPESSDHHA